MKKIFFMALASAAMSCLTSCDDDDYQGMALSGQWNGDFGMSYDYYDRYYGHERTVDCYDTDLEFVPYENSYTRGYGYQIDYYDYGPYDEIYHTFYWQVRNGVIYIDYRGEDELSTAIRDYKMTNNRLTGYFVETGTYFSLCKYQDYYDWTPYIEIYGDYRSGDGYGYHGRGGYYAPTRNAEDSVKVPADKPEILRYRNRYAEKN